MNRGADPISPHSCTGVSGSGVVVPGMNSVPEIVTLDPAGVTGAEELIVKSGTWVCCTSTVSGSEAPPRFLTSPRNRTRTSRSPGRFQR